MQNKNDQKWQEGLNIDFSRESKNKDAIKHDLLSYLELRSVESENLDEKEIVTMKKNKGFFNKVKTLPVAIVIGVLVLSVTAFAIHNYISLGKHANYLTISKEQESRENGVGAKTPLEDGLAGKLYDEMGNMAITYGDIMSGAYNENGEAVTISMNQDGSVLIETVDDSQARRDESTTSYSSIKEAKKHLAFDFNAPSYIPSGYSIDGYKIYKNDDGTEAFDGKYVEISMVKDGDASKQVYIQLRFMDEETAFSTGGTGLEKTVINGHEAVVSEDSIDILIDDVMYMIMSSTSELPIEEIIKIAEAF